MADWITEIMILNFHPHQLSKLINSSLAENTLSCNYPVDEVIAESESS